MDWNIEESGIEMLKASLKDWAVEWAIDSGYNVDESSMSVDFQSIKYKPIKIDKVTNKPLIAVITVKGTILGYVDQKHTIKKIKYVSTVSFGDRITGGGGGSSAVALVAEQGSGELSEVDITSGSVTTVATGLDWPTGVAINSDGSIAYVTELFSGYLTKVNLSTGETTRFYKGFIWPSSVAISSDDKTVYVLSIGGLYAINTSTGANTLITNSLHSAAGIAIESTGTTALTTDNPNLESKLVRVNLITGVITEIANLFSTSAAVSVAIEPGGNTALVNTSFKLKRVNLLTKSVITFPIEFADFINAFGLVAESDGLNALVTLNGSFKLARVNLSTSKVTIIVPMTPITLVAPAGIALLP